MHRLVHSLTIVTFLLATLPVTAVLAHEESQPSPAEASHVDSPGRQLETSTQVPGDSPAPTDTVVTSDTPPPVETPTDTPAATEAQTPTHAPSEVATPAPSLESETLQVGTTWYVAPGGSDSNDCLGASTPCAMINSAIGRASAGDTILVAEGVYTGTGDNVVVIDKDIELFGGWDANFGAPQTMSTVDGQGTRRGVRVNAGVSAVILGIEIVDGRAPAFNSSGGGVYNAGKLDFSLSAITRSEAGFGGGIFNDGGDLTLSDLWIIGNMAESGGGIDNFSGGSLVISRSTIQGNSAVNGGGIRHAGNSLAMTYSTVADNNATGGGGGILSYAPLTLTRSTVSGNSAGAGGGIATEGGSASIATSTISGNAANGPAGGISHNSIGSLQLLWSTVTGNTAANGGGLFVWDGASNPFLESTLLGGNQPGDCAGTITSAGHNLVGNTEGCTILGDMTGNVTGVDPLLGPLADNGSRVLTHALLPGSPAIDAGGADCPSEDQRGEPRPVDGNSDGEAVCDIGAFEAPEGTTPLPSPYLRAFPDGDFVDGELWPANQAVSLQVGGLILETTAGSDGHVEFTLAEHDLVRGDVLTMTSGEVVVVHTVKQLFVTDLNVEAQTVSGTVDGQQVVHVFSGPGDLYVDADENGIWLADFSGYPEPILFLGGCGNAEAWGEGSSSTIIDWCLPPPPPNPRFTVFPEWEFFDGLDWPDGPVTITVADKPECEVTRQSSGGFFNGNFGEGCDLQIGDTVTFTDGTTTRTHVVRNLAVTTVDDVADTVAGTADPGETVHVWPHEAGEAEVQLIVGDDETWLADFSGRFDLVPGTEGRSEIRDVTGNATAVDWRAPNPRMEVFPESELFNGLDWPDGMVTITVGDKPQCSVTKESSGGFFNGNFGDGCDLQIGDTVTFTDGETVRTHVVRNLFVTDVNEAEDTVIGTADPGEVVNVWPHETGEQVQVTVDSEGAWQVDFTGAYDIVPGSAGRSQIDDEIGNATALDWEVPLNYDIYVFDTRTRETKRISTLSDTGEYNPSWSPTGKKIAHDAWNPISGAQAIYLTDVATGVSTPLEGAQNGGNDAAWSPDGRWIAFDKDPAGDPSLYVVPSGGGTPRLLRNDGVAAAWSPSGKRLVFRQPSDGSLRTIGADGRVETLVARSGADPAWSPNGLWIAYDDDGSIWKVRVDPQGVPHGAPIRLMTGDGWQPTWSANSRTIAFHSGIGMDVDIWTLPAEGGTATWLTGAPAFGDYDPDYSKSGRYVAYASFSSAAQVPRQWVAAYIYDPPVGALAVGNHPYHFEFEWSMPSHGTWSDQEGEVAVSSEAPSYDGYVLLRGPEELRGLPDGSACEAIDSMGPSQLTRFLVGWLTDGELAYPQALDHFGSIRAEVVWDETMSAKLTRHEIMPWPSSVDDWFQYVCSFAVRE